MGMLISGMENRYRMITKADVVLCNVSIKAETGDCYQKSRSETCYQFKINQSRG